MTVGQAANRAQGPGDNVKTISIARAVSKCLSIAVAVYGLTVICAWLFDIRLLKGLISPIISLKINTAWCFLLAGAGLWLLRMEKPATPWQRWQRYAAYVCAAIIAVIALLTLVEYASGADLGIDQLILGGQYGAAGAGISSRMALYTAVNFLLVAVAMLIMDVHIAKNHLPSQYVFAVVGLISFMVIVGYIFGADEFYRTGPNISMSVNTVIVFIFLFLGGILARPASALTSVFIGNKPGALTISVFVPIIVFLVVFTGWLGLSGQLSGYYSDAFYHALFVEFCIVIVVALLFIAGILTNRMDSILRQGEQKVKEQALLLEEKVNERTRQYRKLTETLQESEERFRLGFENASIGMCLVGMDGSYLRVNAKLCEIFGYTREKMENMNMFDLTYPEDRMDSLDMIKKASVGEITSWHFEKRYVDSRGRIVYAITSPTLIHDATGEPMYFVSQVQDITEKRAAEEELRKHREHLEELVEERTIELAKKTYELEQRNIKLQELDRLKSVFLASMSHELRTPLNSIIGFTGIMLQGLAGELNGEQKKQLAIVRKSANHLLELINDILDISKIEAGKVELSLEAFALSPLIDEVADVFIHMAAEKGLDFKWSVDQEMEIFSDRRRVKQVVMNFVSNAIKFTESGNVTINTKFDGDHTLNISVVDTGTGISKPGMDRLFMPFQQVDFALTKKHEGTGLGLYLSRRIAALLHGDIIAKSSPGEGSEFTFVLPIEYKAEQPDEKSTGD
jgi:PAS domain S-box-containing protein